MDRLQQFSAIENALVTISGSIQRLENIYATMQPLTDVDNGLIDELVVQAGAITGAAESLKLVVFDPAANDPGS